MLPVPASSQEAKNCLLSYQKCVMCVKVFKDLGYEFCSWVFYCNVQLNNACFNFGNNDKNSRQPENQCWGHDLCSESAMQVHDVLVNHIF